MRKKQNVHSERHGGPYDRGSADAYYGRKKDPHFFIKGSYTSELVPESDMRADELEAYHAGYDQCTERKHH